MDRRRRVAAAYLSAWTLLVGLFGCGAGLHTGHKFAIPGPEDQFLEKSKGVLAVREGVAVACAAQNEIKDADVFYLILFNGTNEFLEFDASKVRLLDQSGKAHKPLSRQQRVAKFGARYTPKPPIGVSGDIFRASRAVSSFGDVVSPLNPNELFQAKVMPGSRTAFFVYFPPKSIESSRLTLVVPGIRLGSSQKELTFVFPFEVQRK
ncbi:MAG: hypothetical protein KatS3mg115_0579 [Candidatus Poribacteria bacterium]|nr:MAG: hypothetical protein KatS3mg115_0579 [Candidatus Poribacteria bacterium]